MALQVGQEFLTLSHCCKQLHKTTKTIPQRSEQILIRVLKAKEQSNLEWKRCTQWIGSQTKSSGFRSSKQIAHGSNGSRQEQEEWVIVLLLLVVEVEVELEEAEENGIAGSVFEVELEEDEEAAWIEQSEGEGPVKGYKNEAEILAWRGGGRGEGPCWVRRFCRNCVTVKTRIGASGGAGC
jgi:hypothetical protein